MNVYVQVNHQLLKMLKVYCIHVSLIQNAMTSKRGCYKTNKKLHLKHRLFNQKLAEPIVNTETGEIVVEEGTVLDRRKIDEIMDVL